MGDRGYAGESYAICYTWTYLRLYTDPLLRQLWFQHPILSSALHSAFNWGEGMVTRQALAHRSSDFAGELISGPNYCILRRQWRLNSDVLELSTAGRWNEWAFTQWRREENI